MKKLKKRERKRCYFVVKRVICISNSKETNEPLFGIGRALATEFAKTGEYNLALTARRVDRLNQLKEELLKLSPRPIKVEYRELDVANFASVSPVLEDLAKSLGGKLDLVIANAGAFLAGPVGSGNVAGIKNTVDTNITGAFVTVDAAVAHLRRVGGGGHIVGISSALSFRGNPGTSVYSATKAALNLYLDVVDQEVRQEGITVTTIYPGITKSEMTASLPKASHHITAEDAAQRIIGLINAKAIQGLVPLF